MAKAKTSPTAVERRAEELDTIAAVLPIERRDELAELLTDHDVETLRHLVNQGMRHKQAAAMSIPNLALPRLIRKLEDALGEELCLALNDPSVVEIMRLRARLTCLLRKGSPSMRPPQSQCCDFSSATSSRRSGALGTFPTIFS